MLDHAIALARNIHAMPPLVVRDPDRRERGTTARSQMTTEPLLAAAFDLLRMSVILTDGAAQLIYVNCHARCLLREGRLLRICSGKLSAANPKSALQIRQAIRRCTLNGPPPDLPLGISVALLRTAEPSIAAWVVPMQQRSEGGDLRRAAIFIRNTTDLFSEDMFASLHGATLAELRVLRQLLNGMSVYEVSAALNLSRNTVRTHLKSLFAKTGTTRQSELLRLAALSIAPVSAVEAEPLRTDVECGAVFDLRR